MSVLSNTGIRAGASGAGGGDYQIEKSLRFNDDDSAYLKREFDATGNQKTFTVSFWMKKCTTTLDSRYLFTTEFTTGSYYFQLTSNSNQLQVYNKGASANVNVKLNNVFRDPAAWYHIVLKVDTTQGGDESNRLKIYVNGVHETDYEDDDFPAEDYTFSMLANKDKLVGAANFNDSIQGYYDGYIAEFHYIDGTALDADSFGETNADTGQWVPIEYTGGSYGTNGFHLNFSNTSDLGEDSSGNDNDWTANNLTADPGVATTLFDGEVFSDDVTGSGTFSGTRTKDKMFVADRTDASDMYAYVANSSTSTWIKWTPNTSIPDTAHNGYVWISGGGNDGYGCNDKTIYINDSVETVQATRFPDSAAVVRWYKFTVTGTFTSLKVEGAHPRINAVSFQAEPDWANTHIVDGEDHMSHGVQSTDVDVSTDSPTTFDDEGNGTGNYCTLNPLASALTLSDGNLKATQAANATHKKAYGTFGMKTGAWYWEVTKHTDQSQGGGGTYQSLGLGVTNVANMVLTGFPTDDNHFTYLHEAALYYDDGTNPTSTPAVDVPGGDEHSAGVWMFAFDFDNGKGWVGKDGTWFKPGGTGGNPATGADPIFTNFESGATFCPMIHIYPACSVTANFGATGFAHTPPTGFKALNTFNLDDPTIAISNKHFDLAIDDGADILSTANGLTDGADFVWIKRRADSGFHILFNRINDSGMDGTPNMASNQDYDEDDSGTYSAPSGASVAWVWNAGTANVTNDASATGIGTIDSTYRANPDAGFSIVTYTGNNTDPASVAHGLNAKPALILVKNRDTASKSWVVYHKALGATKYNHLNFSAAATTSADAWDDTEPTSTVWTMQDSSDMNNTDNFVAYVWSEVEGYSKFSEYTGNGSADGPFVYTGFRPTFIIVKRSDANSHWWLFDSVRPSDQALFPGEQDGEQDKGHTFDFLSNGFKLRSTESEVNTDTKPYMYIAFASHPFKYANAQPIEID